MKITDHFSLDEFTSSETAARMGREIVPTPEQLANVEKLCRTILEPMRTMSGRAIVVTSGIRPEWLNVAIGGAAKSAHMTGRAADIKVIGMTPAAVCAWVKRQVLPVDKCIDEFGQWVHIQIADGDTKPRQQYLVARKVNGATVYTEMA